MSGPWSPGFSSGFGLLTLASNKDPGLMALLGTNTTTQLYYDYSETECFFLFILPSDFGLDFNSDFGPLTTGALYKITPSMAQAWFGTAGRVIYNPFTSIPASTVL